MFEVPLRFLSGFSVSCLRFVLAPKFIQETFPLRFGRRNFSQGAFTQAIFSAIFVVCFFIASFVGAILLRRSHVYLQTGFVHFLGAVHRHWKSLQDDFTTKSSKKLTLGLIWPKQKFLGPKLAFMNI